MPPLLSRLPGLILLAALAALPAAAADRPNILLIVADDLGYADLGAYGSDIATPNIDRLASRGVLFTQFHTAPMCAPSRAMLLSGNNNHVAGMASQQRDGLLGHPFPGYENGLSARVAALPRLLHDAGYDTYAVGKWHLGERPQQSPAAAGFARSWMMLDGAGTHFDGVGFENRRSTYWADDDYAEYPDGEYATAWYTDRLLDFIDADRDSGRPFFAYAAYTSPHWPLQVPDAWLQRYAGRYDDGYEALRARRFASLQAAGIVAPGATLPPANPAIAPWDALGDADRRRESRKMELYAAMVENLDAHVGRLIGYLQRHGLYDNTWIVFMADNGAAGEDFFNTGPFVDYLREHFDNRYELMGTRASFVSYGPPWAEAGSAPFSRYKTYAREGGIVAPLIIAGPGLAQDARIDHSYLTIMDLAPTLLELAHTVYPEREGIAAMLGESLLPYLAGRREHVHDAQYVTTLYHRGNAFLRRGPWKIVTPEPPFDESRFELFNLDEDPGETTDLRQAEPAIYEQLLSLWRSERRRLGILLPRDL
jgi:arylsulfatase